MARAVTTRRFSFSYLGEKKKRQKGEEVEKKAYYDIESFSSLVFHSVQIVVCGKGGKREMKLFFLYDFLKRVATYLIHAKLVYHILSSTIHNNARLCIFHML